MHEILSAELPRPRLGMLTLFHFTASLVLMLSCSSVTVIKLSHCRNTRRVLSEFLAVAQADLNAIMIVVSGDAQGRTTTGNFWCEAEWRSIGSDAASCEFWHTMIYIRFLFYVSDLYLSALRLSLGCPACSFFFSWSIEKEKNIKEKER